MCYLRKESWVTDECVALGVTPRCPSAIDGCTDSQWLCRGGREDWPSPKHDTPPGVPVPWPCVWAGAGSLCILNDHAPPSFLRPQGEAGLRVVRSARTKW